MLMNLRHISLILLILNVGLLGVVMYLTMGRAVEGGPQSMEVLPQGERLVTNTVTQIAVRKVNATNLLAALANRPLSWRALESTNYQIYIQNLRNFGCPEETVRDIIITDVAKLYSKRRADLRLQSAPRAFWQTYDLNNGAPGDPPILRDQLIQLEREQRELIKDLLGVDFHRELSRYSGDDENEEQIVSFLPESKRETVRALHERFSELQREIYERANGVLLDEDRNKLSELQRRQDAEMAGILNPEELLQYQLHNSETANNLRIQLNGFQPSQEEFVKIFQLQKNFDDQFDLAFDHTDDTAIDLKNRAQHDAQAALEDEIRKTLGNNRYAEYQRAQDGDYRALLQIADRYQLNPDVANQVYNLKVASERQKQQIESLPNLSDQQRAQMLASVAQQAERNVASALGADVYRSYSRELGHWLNDLYFFDEANIPPTLPVQNQPMFPPVPPGLINSLPPGYRELLLNAPGGIPPDAR
jgi:hypothetical protein